ncbi:FHA domain-containing protein [Agromyces sp. SYSU K20354]|uniref:FHA domain-containing protein n=1 Tax=Agromyces cavernae TaxID=2898659 RepID=UPI001E60AC4A|nr:FHA domain-containing protein [Agromyces cavernae]MCD2442502.1 FHA domain-containing protein [Agromyces cavernae]
MADYLSDGSGRRVAGVRPGVVLVVAGDDAAATVGELWPALSPDSTTAVIERLTARGLGSTPDFALVTWTRPTAAGTVRVLVRGGFEVTAGSTRISGVDVSTWTERLLEAPAEVEIAALGAEAGEAWFPIVDGVVPAGRVAVPARSTSAAPVVPAEAATPPAPVTGASAPPAPRAVPAPDPISSESATLVAPAVVAASEHTIASVDEATVTDFIEPIPAPTLAAASDQRDPGDHDGLTIASVDIRRLRAEHDASKVGDVTLVPTEGGESAEPPAPQPQLRLPDGALEPIGHELVLGRAPSVSKVSGGRLPRLVTIGHGDPDISRSHVRLALEGGTVVVTDLHSRNGTLVVAPGKPPVKLRAGEPTPVLIGTVVDLGGGCTLQVVGA